MRRLVISTAVYTAVLSVRLVSPVSAATVGMEYSDPDHLHAPGRVSVCSSAIDCATNDYVYDADGRRIVKKSDQRTQTYVDVRYQLSTINNEQSSSKYYFANGRRIATSNQQLATRYLHHDHLGSTVLTTNSNSQKITEPLSYFPYGNKVSMSQGVKVSMSYLYTGQELDDEFDLYNYNARLYNPTTGAFISADSVGGGNRYAYAANNPLIFTDPTGHMDIAEGGGGGGGGGPADLEYEITGGVDQPGITATGVIDLEPIPLPPGNPEDFPKLIMGMAAFSSAAVTAVLAAPVAASYLTFTYAYYYYNHFYSERMLSPLRIPVGDVMWMESATGETLSLDMSEEAWEEVYQASKMMVEEYGVEVTELSRSQYEILNKLGNKPPGGEAAYVPLTGGPGWIFVVENPARLRTLYLGHEFRHFSSHWSAGFPAGGLGAPEPVSEVDAYRFIFANRAYLAPEEAKSLAEVFKAMFGLD